MWNVFSVARENSKPYCHCSHPPFDSCTKLHPDTDERSSGNHQDKSDAATSCHTSENEFSSGDFIFVSIALMFSD